MENRSSRAFARVVLAPRMAPSARLAVRVLMFLAAVTLALGLVGCGDYQGESTTISSVGSGATTASTADAPPAPAPTVLDVAVPAPAVDQPEQIIRIGWGHGPGEVALGEGDFGTGGPDLFAVSPDGRTIAVYDTYADPRRVNFYSDGQPVGAVDLDRPPMGLAVNNNREVYALYQLRPTSELVHLAASGEVLETLAIDGTLDPMGPLVWAGSSLYAFAGVGGTEDDGYLLVASDGSSATSADLETGREAVTDEYPLPLGNALLEEDPAGEYVLTVSGEGQSAITARLLLPVDPSLAAGSLFGNALGGLPVIMFYSSEGGQPSTGYFVAVDVATGSVKRAAVRFDWTTPGGGVVVGEDAVYVMRGDLEVGLDLQRVPFR